MGSRIVLSRAALLLALGVASPAAVGGQDPPRRAAGHNTLRAAIAEIEAGRQTTPLVGEAGAGGDATVTFLAKRIRGRAPRIVSDVTGWGERADGTFNFNVGRMTRVGRTEWYSLQANVAARARIEYLIAYGPADFRLDPHNPRRSAWAPFGVAPASEFVTPGYVPPVEFTHSSAAAAGRITEAALDSQVLRGSRRLKVYTPAGYREGADHAVAVFLDVGADVVSRVLDSLIDRRTIEPTIAVFVDSNWRGEEYRSGGPMRAFLAEELPAWLRSRYGGGSARRRAILGISYGARNALDAAVGSTQGFDRLGLLVPGRRIGPSDIAAIAEGPQDRLRVAILAGQYDQANIATARAVRQALADAGHAVDYTEVPEGHNRATWLNHLGVVLVSLFGTPPE